MLAMLVLVGIEGISMFAMLVLVGIEGMLVLAILIFQLLRSYRKIWTQKNASGQHIKSGKDSYLAAYNTKGTAVILPGIARTAAAS